ncbi:OmpA family protein [Defluviitalea phaphyphila]|uniref:OmpA family protein n=1 Tax=Defluviitalea phaphyphila TaxID=1473580 RepID=UPI0007317129|nr:OmpA family protein [Defluviitalea phaphyphila]
MLKKIIHQEENSFWISISDLMSSVLIIFILLFIFKMLDYQGEIEKQEIVTSELEKLQEELKQTKEKVIELSSTRLKIIQLLKEEFEKENIDIVIDENTGAIKLKEGILFDTSKSDIKPEGKEFLQKFMPIYFDILLGNEEIRKELGEIIIEGHTDDISTYIYNLKLSQDRSFSVVNFLMSDEFEYKNKELLTKYLTANGRSFSDLIYKDNGEVDRDSSRRVEFKFKLKEEETLLQIKTQLEKGEQYNE